jgi:hypothetical protein
MPQIGSLVAGQQMVGRKKFVADDEEIFAQNRFRRTRASKRSDRAGDAHG